MIALRVQPVPPRVYHHSMASTEMSDGGDRVSDPRSTPTVDGRLLRGERSRQAIAEAMIALVETGNQRPTARAIAERAGVSLRLVFHHFDDVEAVFEAAGKLQHDRHWRSLRAPDPALPLAARIEALCRQRRKLFEEISAVRRTAYARAGRSPALARVLADTREELRAGVAATFAPELDRAGADAPGLLDRLDVAAGWETWDTLRDRLSRSRDTAEQTVRRLLSDLLD